MLKQLVLTVMASVAGPLYFLFGIRFYKWFYHNGSDGEKRMFTYLYVYVLPDGATMELTADEKLS